MFHILNIFFPTNMAFRNPPRLLKWFLVSTVFLDNSSKLKKYFFLWAYMPKEYFLERLTLATDEQVKKYGTAS